MPRRSLLRLSGFSRNPRLNALWLLALVPASAVAAPQLLPWPYHEQLGRFDVYAAQRPDAALTRDLARADRLLRSSPIDDPKMTARLFLTDGGWRWGLLAAGSWSAFALRRPLGGGLLLGRSDPASDRIFAANRTRRLSGVVAHEMTHALVAHRLGTVAAVRLPRWVQEGYADHVAQESTLDPAGAARLRRTDPADPALFYFDARRHVEAALASGVTVDRLLQGTAG